MKKTTKAQTTNIIKGIILLAVGIILGIAYLTKYFPFNYSTSMEMSVLTVWSIFGWAFAGIFIAWGLCKLLLD